MLRDRRARVLAHVVSRHFPSVISYSYTPSAPWLSHVRGALRAHLSISLLSFCLVVTDVLGL